MGRHVEHEPGFGEHEQVETLTEVADVRGTPADSAPEQASQLDVYLTTLERRFGDDIFISQPDQATQPVESATQLVESATQTHPAKSSESSVTGRPSAASAKSPSELVRLYLLGGFELTVGRRPVALAPGLKRLIALLALRGHGTPRSYVAGVLWGYTSEARAQGSLRSNLSKLKQTGLELVEISGDSIELSGEVEVDLYQANKMARSVIDSSIDSNIDSNRDDNAGSKGHGLLEPRMCSELLPGWYDDWVIAERERHRQLTLHALEFLCESFVAERKYAAAVMAGLAAVDQEPLRESSHRALIKAYLAEDNAGEALRCYERYRGLAAEAFGVDPSPAMKDLLAGVGAF